MSGLDVFDDHWPPGRSPSQRSHLQSPNGELIDFYARREGSHWAVWWWRNDVALDLGDLIKCFLPTATVWLIPIWLPTVCRSVVRRHARAVSTAAVPRCHDAESSAERSGQTVPLAGQRHLVRLPVRRRRSRPPAHRAEGTNRLEPHAQRGHRGDKFPWKLQLLLATRPGEEIPREVCGDGVSETPAGPELRFSSGHQCFLYR